MVVVVVVVVVVIVVVAVVVVVVVAVVVVGFVVAVVWFVRFASKIIILIILDKYKLSIPFRGVHNTPWQQFASSTDPLCVTLPCHPEIR